MLSHPLTKFGIQNYYQKDTQLSSKREPKFNGFYSKINLPKRKDWAYVINLDKFESIRTGWIALYVDGNNVIY